jgi:hypothetical protein
MYQLPTDEEYLNELYDRLKDEAWIAMQQNAVKRQDPAARARQAVAEGTFKEDQLNALIEAIEESINPLLYFRGKYIELLKSVALAMTNQYRNKLESVPVGCLPTRNLNAGAYSTPRGGAVILLDSGVILQLGLLVRAYFAYYTWNAPDHFAAGTPYCRDHSRDAFGRTVQRLAAYSATGNLNQLRQITTLDCPSLETFDPVVENFAMGIEIFIMLHEYGHIALNHLGTCSSVPVRLRPEVELTLFTNSQIQEFQADEFAFRHYSSSKLRPTDVAFCCGLLFHFFHLAELIRPPQTATHPPALSRWKKIKELTLLAEHPEGWANYLDDTFPDLWKDLADL